MTSTSSLTSNVKSFVERFRDGKRGSRFLARHFNFDRSSLAGPVLAAFAWLFAIGYYLFLMSDQSELEDLREQLALRKLLAAAAHALRSYQHGNASPDLAKDMADTIDARLNKEASS